MSTLEPVSTLWSPSNETFSSSITRVDLQKSESGGYGFNVVGGKDSEHLPGVPSPFVSFVSRDGVAERMGLKEGDRIIAINGLDVDVMTHDEIISQLKRANRVQLTIEQNGEERILTASMASRSFVMPTSLITPLQDRTAAYVADLQEHPIGEEPDPIEEEQFPEEVEAEVVPPEIVNPSTRRSAMVILGAGVVIGALAALSFKHGRLLLKIGGFQ